MAVPESSEEGSPADSLELTGEEEDVVQNSNDQLLGVDTEQDELGRKKQGIFVYPPPTHHLTTLSSSRFNIFGTELERMCCILGINYKAKLAEFGSKVDEERVDEALAFLRVTRDDNYNELKMISEEIIKEWKVSNTPFKTMYKISWIMYIYDSDTADELRGQNFLSLASVDKARKELSILQKERHNKYKKKYIAQRKKLIGMLEEMHLTSADVQFEENKPVSEGEYISEKRKVKRIIRKVKSVAAERKE